MIAVFTGEPYQVDQALHRFKEGRQGAARLDAARLDAARLDAATSPFNFDLFYGREVKGERLLECCRTLPALAARRLVIVREAEKIARRELEFLEAHLEGVPGDVDLFFVGEKLDRRVGFWRKVAAQGEWREFHLPSVDRLPVWIQDFCRARKIMIERDAVLWLADRFGADLQYLVSVIEKASLLKKDHSPLTIAQLEEVEGGALFSSLFELTDAVGSKDLDRALTLYRRMLHSGESLVGLVALLARHFRLVWRAKEGGEPVPPYFRKKYEGQARLFSTDGLSNVVDWLFRADWDLKSSPIPPELVVEDLIRRIASNG